MRVKMLVTLSAPPAEGEEDGKTLHLHRGKEYDLPEQRAKELIDAGEAIDPATEPEVSDAEAAVRPHVRSVSGKKKK